MGLRGREREAAAVSDDLHRNSRNGPFSRIAQRILDVPYAIDDTVATDMAMPKDVYACIQGADLRVEGRAACNLGEAFESETLDSWEQVAPGEEM